MSRGREPISQSFDALACEVWASRNEAEWEIIAGYMADPVAARKAAWPFGIKPRHFFDDDARRMFCIIELAIKGKPTRDWVLKACWHLTHLPENDSMHVSLDDVRFWELAMRYASRARADYLPAAVHREMSLWCARLIDLHRRLYESDKHAKAIRDLLMMREPEQHPAAKKAG